MIRIKLFPCYVKWSQECSHCHLCPASAVGIPSQSDSCDSMPPLSLKLGFYFSEFGPTYICWIFVWGLERGICTSANIVGKRLLAEKSRCGKMVERWGEKMSKSIWVLVFWLSAFSSICFYFMYFHFTCQYTLFIIRISLRTCSFFKMLVGDQRLILCKTGSVGPIWLQSFFFRIHESMQKAIHQLLVVGLFLTLCIDLFGGSEY